MQKPNPNLEIHEFKLTSSDSNDYNIKLNF